MATNAMISSDISEKHTKYRSLCKVGVWSQDQNHSSSVWGQNTSLRGRDVLDYILL
jgi:hypothetical protein